MPWISIKMSFNAVKCVCDLLQRDWQSHEGWRRRSGECVAHIGNDKNFLISMRRNKTQRWQHIVMSKLTSKGRRGRRRSTRTTAAACAAWHWLWQQQQCNEKWHRAKSKSKENVTANVNGNENENEAIRWNSTRGNEQIKYVCME